MIQCFCFVITVFLPCLVCLCDIFALQLMVLYSSRAILIIISVFLFYILLSTQAPILVWFDGTIIDINTILVTMYYCGYVGFYDRWRCMVIDISVQYMVGFSPTLYC